MSAGGSGRGQADQRPRLRILLLSQRLRSGFDRRLAPDGLSTAQAMLISVAASFGATAPSFGELADALSTSHQNVAQLAKGLVAKEFVHIERDADDRRVRRIRVTQESRDYFARRDGVDFAYVEQQFEALEADELLAFSQALDRLLQGTKSPRTTSAS